jgi:hypothetical protein
MGSRDLSQRRRPVPFFILLAAFKQPGGRCIHPVLLPETCGRNAAQSAHKTFATALAKGIVLRVIPISRINFLP